MKLLNKYYPLYILIIGFLPLVIEYQKQFTTTGSLAASICFAVFMSMFALVCWRKFPA